MAETKTLEEQVVEVVAKALFLDPEQRKQVTLKADFIKDLGADSLDCIDLRMQLEHQFKVEIADDDYKEINTPQQAADYIRKHQK